MKYFWGYVALFVVIWLICSYVVTIRDEAFTTESESVSTSESVSESEPVSVSTSVFKNNLKTVSISTKAYDPVIGIPDYHVDEETIRKQNKHKMNNLYVKGEYGVVAINMEPTQTFPTFYEPGSFPYGATSYVPKYEDAIKLGLVDLDKPFASGYEVVRTSNGLNTLKRPEETKIRTTYQDVMNTSDANVRTGLSSDFQMVKDPSGTSGNHLVHIS